MINNPDQKHYELFRNTELLSSFLFAAKTLEKQSKYFTVSDTYDCTSMFKFSSYGAI